VGAPLEDTTSGYNNSVRLQQFDMTYLDTYAFEYHTSIDITDGPWVNVWPYDHEVAVGDGLTLSNYVAGTGTIVMEGYPVSGSVSYSAIRNDNNRFELISNPFPSAIDFDAFQADNNSTILSKYWIYDPNAGNYVARSSGIGGSQYVQHGQGFFVQTLATGTITFSNSHKTHSAAPFRDIKANLLSLEVNGGSIGFKDYLYIHFSEEGTFAYDEEVDAAKFNSVSDGATMIRSIAEDGKELAINVLPVDRLASELVTVPIHFECGELTEYTFTFKGLESFDYDTEVWIEDLQTGSEWINISESDALYAFTASPGEEKHRFNIHFFGPTSVPGEDQLTNEKSIRIYSSKHDVYIKNPSQQHIQEIQIYDIMGNLLSKTNGSPLPLIKQYISNKTGYYIVRVLTDKNVYTQKILIVK
jgi:hypothetical protein